eukprot:3332554-Amphidinium_carterae.1
MTAAKNPKPRSQRTQWKAPSEGRGHNPKVLLSVVLLSLPVATDEACACKTKLTTPSVQLS